MKGGCSAAYDHALRVVGAAAILGLLSATQDLRRFAAGAGELAGGLGRFVTGAGVDVRLGTLAGAAAVGTGGRGVAAAAAVIGLFLASTEVTDAPKGRPKGKIGPFVLCLLAATEQNAALTCGSGRGNS